MLRTLPLRRSKDLPIVVVALLAGACALPFPEYELASGGASSTGGAATTGGSSGEPNGAPCERDEGCVSGHCLPEVGGGLVCCAVDCLPEEPASCGTTGQCLGGTECVRFPDGLVCGAMESCDGATSYTQRCQDGACEPFGVPCANGLNCAPDGGSCLLTCDDPAEDCAESAGCFNGTCLKSPGETCSNNEECISQFCGSTGTGRCCAAECMGTGLCDFDCDEAGACVLATATTVCGATEICTEGNQLEATFCDGMGACEATPETHSCEHNLACEGVDGCWSSCLSTNAEGDARCAEGYWCNNFLLPAGTFECAAKLEPFALCNRNTQCLSGLCSGFLCAP